MSVDGEEKGEDDLMDGIWKCMASCLLLGELEFKQGKKEVEVINTDVLQKIAKLLGCKPDRLEYNMCFKDLVVVGKVIPIPNTLARTVSSRDALAKQIYENMFDFLVVTLNLNTKVDEEEFPYTIGLLDIFGFENFDPGVNSLEQLCINFTNEKLQGVYLKFVFEKEKKFFKDQGKDQDWIEQRIQFTSNDIKIITCEIVFFFCMSITNTKASTISNTWLKPNCKWVTKNKKEMDKFN